MSFFSKILIANRGEIACRIIKTCKRLGIQTVAVYSEADQNALHVDQADEAVLIGPAPASESYLQVDKIIEVAQNRGAQAIHPGYGFLSENAGFAEKLAQAGIKLIGPSPKVIELMGDKIKAREQAVSCGVNVIPGTGDPVSDIRHAKSIAADIGYPLMIKAAAGGGGKGMRLARDESQLIEGVEGAQREAQSSFGDARIFIEKFIEKPRHIEVQILGDSHGNVVHLGERECSIQRRHQKVIEESPSPFINEKTRSEMTAQAVKLAQAVGYESAGTVEFIADQSQNFYFLEMNTRLQVEHAVTEMVTGRDLVEDMIRIAAGEPLGFSQSDVDMTGHSVEARVYAEDPTMDFIPSPGKLFNYQEPENVRMDSGVEEGDEVSLFYDPMISKVITHGTTRQEAYAQMGEALNSYVIRGLGHNISFLNALVNHPKVLKGDIHTHFIAEEYPNGFDPEKVSGYEDLFKHAAALLFAEQNGLGHVLIKKGEAIESLSPSTSGYKLLESSDTSLKIQGPAGKTHTLQYSLSTSDIILEGYGAKIQLEVYPSHLKSYLRHLPKDGGKKIDPFITTPMPGKLIQLMIKEGDSLKRGQPVAIVEAMKMENILRAPQDGLVKKICANEGQTLESKQRILEVG